MDQSSGSRAWRLHRPTRREFLISAGAVAFAGLALDTTAIERHAIVVERRTVRIRRLPTAFHGLRVVQLSDFHHRDFSEDSYLRTVVEKVNALRPTVVALTGDFITSYDRSRETWRKALPVCAEILSGLTAPVRLCVLGNHDIVDADHVARVLTEHKLRVLFDEHTALDLRGDRIWFAGLNDMFFVQPDLNRAIPTYSDKSPVIVLGHEPDFADTVAAHGGADLMLTGHTHGGQIRLPGLKPLFLPDGGKRYLEGEYRLRTLQLYVNRGIGAVHAPIRFRCPPEITLLTLQPEM